MICPSSFEKKERNENTAMPVNGLILTLSPDVALANQAVARIAREIGVKMGPTQDRWQPLAVDLADVAAAHDFHEWLEAQPGVERVDVIYVGFDTPTETLP